jgi:hypothetical protein
MNREAPATSAPGYYLPLGILFALSGLVLATILFLNDGRFTYTGDDPYIHLALAENIARGHYGINLNEYSAPSSSILWPYLLALFSPLPYDDLVPFWINLLSTVVTVLLTSRIFDLLTEGPPGSSHPLARGAVVSVLALALVGPAFSGMEHSLQILLSTVVLLGFVRSLRDDRMPWWFLLAAVVGPLVRYESLAFAIAAFAYLLYRRKYLAATLLVLCIGIPLIAFSAYLDSLGLGFVPTSIVAKSEVVRRGGSVVALLVNAWDNIFRLGGPLLYVLIALLVKVAISADRSLHQRLLATFVGLAAAVHACAGSFGRYGYEIYVSYPSLIAVAFLYRESWRKLLTGTKVWAGAVVLAVVLSFQYILYPLVTPLMANNVYEQQYQMHRFVTDYYRVPVLVNDLGWVSYRNDEYVLDLQGLGSPLVFEHGGAGISSERLESLARGYGVKIAMVHPVLSPVLPDRWVKVGALRLGNPRLGAAAGTVEFFVADDADRPTVIRRLEEFRTTLPGRVRLELTQPR